MRMPAHTLSTFAFLLKLGLWGGGSVSGLGYVSAAERCTEAFPVAGLNGLWLCGGVALEKHDPAPAGGQRLVLSVDDPYSGECTTYAVRADFDLPGMPRRALTREAIENALVSALGEAERSARRGPKPRGYTPYRDKLRYEAAHSSVRTGRISTPRKK